MLARLPDEPCGLIDFQKHDRFYDLVQWETISGNMESRELLDHSQCGIFHTKFDPGTELGWHIHGKDTAETIVCLEGEISVYFKKHRVVTLRAGERLDIPAGNANMAVVGDKPTQIIAMTVPRETKQQKKKNE